MLKIDPLALGKWVKAKRKAKDMTQEDLAKSAGITRYQLIRIENGESKTTRETAAALAVALGEYEGEALRLAGYDGEPLPEFDTRLAREIEPYLMRLGPDRRAAAERMLVNNAREIAEMFATA